jgi:hypothetical protein
MGKPTFLKAIINVSQIELKKKKNAETTITLHNEN